jgi:hypothetical protein
MNELIAPVQEPALATALYVAVDLTAWETDQPDCFARDVTIDGVAFRVLDPEYYAWLRHRMTLAKETHVAVRMPGDVFDRLRHAFNEVHAQALARFGERDLLRALDRLRPKNYDAPKAFDSGRTIGLSEGPGHFTRVVLPHALAQVDELRDKALALGWSHESLYRTQGRFAFPCGQDYGLVCFVGERCHVGAVTFEYIEIFHDGRAEALRFYNPERFAGHAVRVSGR